MGWETLGVPAACHLATNSIVAYCMAEVWQDFIIRAYRTHVGDSFFKQWGEVYAPLAMGVAVLLTYWLILFWMYRKRILYPNLRVKT